MTTQRVPEELFFVDRSSSRALQAQIRESIVSAVLDRRMPPGARLPSTRKLAKHLKVSRLTITLAYQELVYQGYLAASARSSYLVSDMAPSAQLDRGPQRRTTGGLDWDSRLAGNLTERRQIEKPYDWRAFPFPFVYGQMDMSLFHHNAWRDCARRALGRRDFEETARDAAAADDPILVNYICSRTLPRRGITAEPSEILVTVGAQNALWLTIQLLAKHGLHAVCENPATPTQRPPCAGTAPGSRRSTSTKTACRRTVSRPMSTWCSSRRVTMRRPPSPCRRVDDHGCCERRMSRTS